MCIESLHHLWAQYFDCVDLMKDVDRNSVLNDFIGDPFKWAKLSPACVQNKNSNVQIFKWVANCFLILADLGHFREVRHDIHCLDSWHLLFNFLQFILHLLLISRDNTNIELVIFGAFHSHFEANAVRSPSDYSPRLFTLCLWWQSI